MTNHTCLACGKVHADASEVVLRDGRTVSSYSEEWRMECEARAVLRMPSTYERRRYLFGAPDDRGNMVGGIAKKRGKDAADKLAAVVKQLWDARQSASLAA